MNEPDPNLVMEAMDLAPMVIGLLLEDLKHPKKDI